MSIFDKRHPDKLTNVIAAAALQGQAANSIHRELGNGTFRYWDEPYDMPLSTVKHYAREARKRQAAKIGSPTVERHGLSGAVGLSASKLFAEVERRVEATIIKRPAASNEELEELAKLLVTLEKLGKAAPKRPDRKPAARATDPLMAAAQHAAKATSSSTSAALPTRRTTPNSEG